MQRLVTRRTLVVAVLTGVLGVLLGAGIVLLAAERVGTISIGWSEVVHDDLAAYRVYYGCNEDPEAPTCRLPAGETCSSSPSSCDVRDTTELALVLDELEAAKYYVALKSVSAMGLVSAEFSPELVGYSLHSSAHCCLPSPATVDWTDRP